jgi:hypothetical protein
VFGWIPSVGVFGRIPLTSIADPELLTYENPSAEQ